MHCECQDCPTHDSINCGQPAVGRYQPTYMPDSTGLYLCAECLGDGEGWVQSRR